MERRGVRSGVAVGAGLAAGLVLGLALGSSDAPPTPRAPELPVSAPPTDPSVLQATIEDLERALQAERDARRGLEAEVALLRDAIAADPGEAPAPAPPQTPERAPVANAGEGGFDAAVLESLGLPLDEAERLRSRYDEYQLAELYLRDLATREGWHGKPRWFRERRALQDALREEVGDRDYDHLLFGAGRNNRVVVASLMARSPAAEAGVRPGDVLLAYDGQRVFDGREITRRTTTGRAGASTELRVQREGLELRLYLPRGPLGVRLRPERRPPETF